FPFPEESTGDVKRSFIYVPEGVVWHRMGQKYPTRFVNEVFAIKEYQPGGISDRSRARLISVENARATVLCAEEIMKCGRRLRIKHAFRSYANYVRYSLHARFNL